MSSKLLDSLGLKILTDINNQFKQLNNRMWFCQSANTNFLILNQREAISKFLIFDILFLETGAEFC